MLFKHSANHDGSRVFVVLFQEILGHFQEIAEDFSGDKSFCGLDPAVFDVPLNRNQNAPCMLPTGFPGVSCLLVKFPVVAVIAAAGRLDTASQIQGLVAAPGENPDAGSRSRPRRPCQ